MKRKTTILVFLLGVVVSFSQVKGKVDNGKELLRNVSVYMENTYIGSTTNELGEFYIDIKEIGSYTLMFKCIGYKALRKEVEITEFPFEINVSLEAQIISIDEVVLKKYIDPAKEIIKEVIKVRKAKLNNAKEYEADFYSKGIFRIIEAPDKIMGTDIRDIFPDLDSTNSGVVYLSETISQIKYKAPDELKEHIIASKVSGSDNGFSFNRASDVNYNIYNNKIELGSFLVSPISDNALAYYDYKLISSYREGGFLINKIKVIPKKNSNKTLEGDIYITEDYWDITSVDLKISGKRMNEPMIDTLRWKQTHNYNSKLKKWNLFSQSIDFEFGMFGINIDGNFTAVYRNYKFDTNFDKKTFGRVILNIDENSNKKDSVFWRQARPMALTQEEITDYYKKDSITT
ncbi:MAG: carboxypeptidase-like regulatory domain-containing protein [Flavobacteriaceae bacterium]|nr:carboxypeptidase-like regulatory domain-containing protein [Flavobacteriaceae bacterium]